MPTKHDHLTSQISEILDSIPGLTVLNAMTSGQEPERPFVIIKNVGWRREDKSKYSGEKNSPHASARVMLEVHIRHEGGEAGLTEERNRLDNLIEHAFDIYAIEDYADDHYRCDGYIHEYLGASGIIDQNDNYGVFVATISVDYLQTPIVP
jgi:hypothetical protein